MVVGGGGFFVDFFFSLCVCVCLPVCSSIYLPSGIV